MTKRRHPGRQSWPFKRSHTCTEKIKHWSWDDAMRHVEELRARTGDEVRVYLCPYGDHYHVGHEPTGRMSK